MRTLKGTALSLIPKLCALLKLGQNASMIRGSIGGITYANNRAGAYARNRSIPVNARTPSQTNVRVRFGNTSNAWGALSSSEQAAWNAAASLVTRTNRIGEAYVPTGRQLFLELNNNLNSLGESPISSPPSDLTPLDNIAVDSMKAHETGNVFDIFGPVSADAPAGDGVVQFSVAPVSVSKRTNYQRYFRDLGPIAYNPVPALGQPNYDLLPAYIALFGDAATAGQQVVIRVRVVSSVSGIASASLIVFADITDV